MNEFITKLKRQLTRKMGNLEPAEDIILDGQTHEYEAYIDGEHKLAFYIASLNPFGENPEEPVLICNYGLINEKEQHTYSSLKI